MRFAEGICVGIFKSCCDRLIGLLEVLKGLCMSVREHISKARCPNSTKFSARVTRGIHRHPAAQPTASKHWRQDIECRSRTLTPGKSALYPKIVISRVASLKFQGEKNRLKFCICNAAASRPRSKSFCSVFSRPRSEGWLHHGRTFSIYLCPLSLWLSLPRGVLSTSWCCPSRPCVVFLACVHLASFLAFSFSRQPPCFLMAWPQYTKLHQICSARVV